MRQLNEYTNNWLITAESSGNIYAGQQAIIGGFNSRLSQGNFSAYTIDQQRDYHGVDAGGHQPREVADLAAR